MSPALLGVGSGRMGGLLASVPRLDSGYLPSMGRAIRLPGLVCLALWMEKGDGVRVACSWLCSHWSGVCSGLLTLFPYPFAVHAAILAINEAVDRGVVEDTLAALQNPSALLGNLREPLAAIYQELLAQAKMEKTANARNCVRRVLECRR